jgi:hypothetical protein
MSSASATAAVAVVSSPDKSGAFSLRSRGGVRRFKFGWVNSKFRNSEFSMAWISRDKKVFRRRDQRRYDRVATKFQQE